MYVVFLRFSTQKSKARELMAAHEAWIARGLEEGVLLLVGSLQPQLGGALLAQAPTRALLEARIREDPFVAHDVVSAEVFEVSPSRADPRLAFLLG